MYELPDRYVFKTLRDGKAFFHKKSYQEHAERHLIDKQEYRKEIQETLINPDLITKHDGLIFDKWFRHHAYYRFKQEPGMDERSEYLIYWKVVIRMVGGSWRWCVVTAFLGARLRRDIINKKRDRIIYHKSKPT